MTTYSAGFTVLLAERLKSERHKYMALRGEIGRMRDDRDKIMKRLRLLRELLTLDGREVILPSEK